ncbi:MAG: hypothetical protein HQM09_14285 [Candidatus Riflebacteria bacterium]|nr:hypothetical protein [Candidatus Riflebacteria bacterium]
MRKTMVACMVIVLLIGVYAFTPANAGTSAKGILLAEAPKDAPKDAPADAAKKEEPKAGGDVPEMITFDNVGKLGAVEFPHKLHGEKNACKDCHEGTAPLFEKKVSKTGFKMADMKAGKLCGFCHDGKDKHPFAASANCMKCHKKK